MSQILKMFGGEKRDKSYKKSAVIDMHVGLQRQFSTLHAVILGSVNERSVTCQLTRGLKANGMVVVDNHMTIMEKCGKKEKPTYLSVALLKYLKENNVDGLIVLTSVDLTKAIDSDGEVVLQLCGVDTKLDARAFQDGIDEEICDKVILVSFNEENASAPVCFKDAERLVLNDLQPGLEITELSIDMLQAVLRSKMMPR